MRLAIHRKLKWTILTVSFTAIVTFLYLIITEIKAPNFKEEKVPVYTYEQRGDISYQVLLKPNILFSEPSLEEGNTYITEFVDSIKAFYKYEFNGEKPSQIQGDYELIASVEGYHSPGRNEGKSETSSVKPIWKKDFVLIPKEGITVNGESLSLDKEVFINYHEYRAFASQIESITKLSSQPKLVVSMNVNLTAETDKGVVTEKQTQSMVIPLNASSFEIQKNALKETTGALEETQQIPVNKKSKVQLLYISIGVMVLLLLFITIFTQGADGDPYMKELKRIFKKYSSRLVASSSELTTNYDYQCSVRSMDDLVRLSDEVEQPVIYKYSDEPKKIALFHVFTDKWMYVFNLNQYIQKSKLDIDQEKKTIIKRSKHKNDFKARVKAAPLGAEMLIHDETE